MWTIFFDIKFLNTRSLTTNYLKICRQKFKKIFEDQPKIAILSETNQCNSGVQTLLKVFRYELGAYKVLLQHNPLKQQRSMLIFIHRTCPLTLTGTERIDNNCIKLKMTRNEMSFAFFCTYAPSDGKDTEFLHQIRRAHLDSEETHSAILGDLNCTIDADMNRIGYTRDHHWQCRAIISEWLESGDLQDAFRHQNPDLRSYTWRQDIKRSKAGRLDYILLSPGLINMMTECYHTQVTHRSQFSHIKI